MDSWEGLWVDGIQVSRLRDGLDGILLAAFTDKMLWAESVCTTGPDGAADVYDVYSLRGQGRAVSQRLSLLGITPDIVLGHVEQALREAQSPIFPIGKNVELTAEETAEQDFLKGYGAADWVRDFREPPGESDHASGFGGRPWLLKQLRHLHPVDALQAVLLTMPDSTVIMFVDQTDSDPDSDLWHLCSNALDEMHATALEQAPWWCSPKEAATLPS